MTEIEHRYLKDNNDNIFYPITHIDAVQGLDNSETETALTDINDKINQMNTMIDSANKTIAAQKKVIDRNKEIIDYFDIAIGDMVGDTGWIDYQVHPNNTKNYISTGSPCAIREVRVGNTLIP